MMRLLIFACFISLLPGVQAYAQDSIPGIGPISPVIKLIGGLGFTEGPTFASNGDLYFSDIKTDKIYKMDIHGKLQLLYDSKYNVDGLKIASNGDLYACEMQGQVVAYSPKGERRVVAATYDDTRFNAPNDLVLDSNGGLYFTDPRFNAPAVLPQQAEAVYYVDKHGSVSRITTALKAPNGIALSPDGKTLYVIPTLEADIMAYPIIAPGTANVGHVFATLAGEKPTGDGATVDANGDLFVATATGIQVFSPEGKPLGTIEVPEQPSNVTFGGLDGQVLLITARHSVYSARMQVKGG